MICKKCNTSNPDDAKFCFSCGSSLNNEKSAILKNTTNKTKKSSLKFVIPIIIILLAGTTIYFFIQNKNSYSDSSDNKSDSELVDDSNTTKMPIEKQTIEPTKEPTTKSTPNVTILVTQTPTSTAKPEETSNPKVILSNISDINSSSWLDEGNNNLHKPSCVFDGNQSTAWVEDVSGYGIGEWISLSFSKKTLISGLTIYNGYNKSESLYSKNSRVKTLRIYYSNTNYKDFKLNDNYLESTTIDFNDTISTLTLKFEISDIYQGTTFEDTCISEISLY